MEGVSSPTRAQDGKNSSFLGGSNGVKRCNWAPAGHLNHQDTLHKREVPFCSQKSYPCLVLWKKE